MNYYIQPLTIQRTNSNGYLYYHTAIDFTKYPGLNEVGKRRLDSAAEDVDIDLVYNSTHVPFINKQINSW